jgi:hypothetical protein
MRRSGNVVGVAVMAAKLVVLASVAAIVGGFAWLFCETLREAAIVSSVVALLLAGLMGVNALLERSGLN